jgi:hypothetical protein
MKEKLSFSHLEILSEMTSKEFSRHQSFWIKGRTALSGKINIPNSRASAEETTRGRGRWKSHGDCLAAPEVGWCAELYPPQNLAGGANSVQTGCVLVQRARYRISDRRAIRQAQETMILRPGVSSADLRVVVAQLLRSRAECPIYHDDCHPGGIRSIGG